MKVIKYKINIKVLTPFHISTGGDEGGFIDKYTVKDIEKGTYIPATALKGMVRDNFYSISDIEHKEEGCSCIMCRIFGKGGYSPSKIFFQNLYSSKKPDLNIRFGNVIDRFRRVAKDRNLYSSEVVEKGDFSGDITLYLPEDLLSYKENIELAIKMISSIGGSKSRGLGRVKVELEEVQHEG